MAVALLDVNVIFALAWEKHLHHHAAHRWFNGQRQAGWATCPMTECGFVRLSSNPKVAFTETTPLEAAGMLAQITCNSGHIFWPDDVKVAEVIQAYASPQLTGHLQVTDAYLLSLAIAHGGKLATFDKRAASLTQAGHTPAVEIISTQS